MYHILDLMTLKVFKIDKIVKIYVKDAEEQIVWEAATIQCEDAGKI